MKNLILWFPQIHIGIVQKKVYQSFVKKIIISLLLVVLKILLACQDEKHVRLHLATSYKMKLFSRKKTTKKVDGVQNKQQYHSIEVTIRKVPYKNGRQTPSIFEIWKYKVLSIFELDQSIQNFIPILIVFLCYYI